MEEKSFIGKYLHFLYTKFFLRFSGQIRDPYIIRVDDIYPDPETHELNVSFHVAMAVANTAIASGLAQINSSQSIERIIRNKMWTPEYLPYRAML